MHLVKAFPISNSVLNIQFSLILLKISCHLPYLYDHYVDIFKYEIICWGFLDLIVQSENGFDRRPSLYSKNLVQINEM